MFPHERSLVKQLSDKSFALIGVNSDPDLEKIQEVVKEKNLKPKNNRNPINPNFIAVSDSSINEYLRKK